MDAQEAAEALMNVSGNAGDLEMEDDDDEVQLVEDSDLASSM